MLGCVQTKNFFLGRNTQTDGLLDDKECECDGDRSPCQNADNTQRLYAQNGEAAAIEQTVINIVCRNGSGCKQTNCQCAPQTIHKYR